MQIITEIKPNLLLEEIFSSGRIENPELLKQNLFKEYNSQICSLLQAYGERRGQVVHFEISEDTFLIIKNVISFSLYYDEHIYEGCKDMNYINEDIELKLELKMKTNHYSIIGPYWEDRQDEDL